MAISENAIIVLVAEVALGLVAILPFPGLDQYRGVAVGAMAGIVAGHLNGRQAKP